MLANLTKETALGPLMNPAGAQLFIELLIQVAVGVCYLAVLEGWMQITHFYTYFLCLNFLFLYFFTFRVKKIFEPRFLSFPRHFYEFCVSKPI